mgnify:CR=1 FL=1
MKKSTRNKNFDKKIIIKLIDEKVNIYMSEFENKDLTSNDDQKCKSLSKGYMCSDEHSDLSSSDKKDDPD